MMRKRIHPIFPAVLLTLLFAGFYFVTQVAAQEPKDKSSLSYNRLYEKAKKLFDQWSEEQNKTKNEKLTPAQRYQQLTLSQRTTFEAITHALFFTKLTDKSGKPMGNTLDLVSSLENIAGEVQGKRGDVQYRIYVKMIPGAEQKLLDSQEFKRDKDNTIFHKDYPLNFREKGPYPSIQVSMTRGGDRADIDVDYNSSKPPQALFNGHLTAGNSDVRAGKNYNRHISHWTGLINWWRGLFKPTPETQAKSTVADVVEPDKSDDVVIENLTDAAQEFFNDWLVRRNTKSALRFYSSNADACLNTDNDAEEEDLNTREARQLFVEVLDTANIALGKPKSLSNTIAAVDPWDPELKVVDHPNKAFYTIVSVSDAEADEFLCKTQSPLEPTQTAPPPVYGNYFETIFYFLYPKGQNDGGMILLWKKEDGKWRIFSYDDLET
jgi:hypothetical protein